MFEGRLRNLKNITRFSHRHLIEPETVAEHTIDMQLIALEMYNILSPKGAMDIPMLKDILFKILVHDLDESVMCDIPRDIKYYSDEFHRIINKVGIDLMKESGISDDLISEMNSAKEGVLGAIVALLDVYQCYLKSMREYLIQDSDEMKDLVVGTSCLCKQYWDDYFKDYENDPSISEWLLLFLKELSESPVAEVEKVFKRKGIVLL